jgi:hypothetical protein
VDVSFGVDIRICVPFGSGCMSQFEVDLVLKKSGRCEDPIAAGTTLYGEACRHTTSTLRGW